MFYISTSSYFAPEPIFPQLPGTRVGHSCLCGRCAQPLDGRGRQSGYRLVSHRQLRRGAYGVSVVPMLFIKWPPIPPVRRAKTLLKLLTARANNPASRNGCQRSTTAAPRPCDRGGARRLVGSNRISGKNHGSICGERKSVDRPSMCASAMSIDVAMGVTSRAVCASMYPPWRAPMRPVASWSIDASGGRAPPS